ncbi:MAG: hypothetical protein ISN28_01620 [Ectothiorhodospiraceae bacterium AqS1]|nr:hypothetical protein [Ectothiorhodospiraceae bacterium AqS1]
MSNPPRSWGRVIGRGRAFRGVACAKAPIFELGGDASARRFFILRDDRTKGGR